MSLRHPPGLIHELLKGMWPMWENVLEDSSIIKEYMERAEKRGEERANARLRGVLLRLGEKRFGPPDPLTRAAVETTTDPNRLAALSERVLEVQSCWRSRRCVRTASDQLKSLHVSPQPTPPRYAPPFRQPTGA
jgi:hypothetical protein